MLTYTLNEKNKYVSLYEHIRGDILSGRISPDEKLPSKRALADHLSVSVVTVQTAYEQLLAEGYVYSVERSGYFASDLSSAPFVVPEKKRETEPKSFEPTKGRASLFPFSVWAKLMRRVLSEEGEHLLVRTPCDGDGELKREIADYLYRARGVVVDPKFVVVGAGAENLYSVILQLLGRDKTIAVEDPGYHTIGETYALYGGNVVHIPVTADGISVEAVENSNAHAVHLSPNHQFPTGAVMPVPIRARLIRWANEGRYVIEDDYDSEFRLTGKPLQSMLGLDFEHVIYVNTFSKTLAPSMRMGYMVLPPELYERYLTLFGNTASVVPLFEQKTLALMLKEGYFERHLSRMRAHYKKLRESLEEKLKRFPFELTIQDRGSGLHFLIKWSVGDELVLETLQKSGVPVKMLSDYASENGESYEKTAVVSLSSVLPDTVA